MAAILETGRGEADRHGRELFWNHLWETLNAAAKTLLFAVVTPLMLAAWGKERFGLFAVANSCIALMVLCDCGLRTLTRVALSDPLLSNAEKARTHAQNLVALGLATFVGSALIIALAAAGCWERWLHLPPGGNLLIGATSALAALTMLLQILLEPIAAAGRLSQIKAALFAGNVVGFALLVMALWRGCGVVSSTLAYFAALGLPLIILLPRARILRPVFVRLKTVEVLRALQPGAWINLITASWLLQSYGLVFLISWVSSPAEAGRFFLFLKLSELLSVLGASASEPTIAALASGQSRADRRARLATAYRSAVALCLAGTIGYAFFCGDLFRLWLGLRVHPLMGLLIGLAGAGTAFGRMITAASLGLARPRAAALGALAGALVTVAAVIFGYGHGGAALVLSLTAAAGICFVPAGVMVSRQLETSFVQLWVRPILRFAPSLGAILLLCASASFVHQLLATLVAVAGSAAIAAHHLFSRDPRARYDTQSRRSALVMRAIDSLQPWKKPAAFSWQGPLVVSSVAGLGDLFIHLPLIAGIVDEARRRGIDIRVALRPAHLMIGRACGWDVFAFDNALEDFFKDPRKLRPLQLARSWRADRRQRPALWIDLTGNAVSALAIKLTGARRIAARITRGGRSLVDHPLPHTIGENEYGNIERVAEHLGCSPDYGIFARLAGAPLPGLQETVVLCLTTICRWRNWPLANFLALVDRFPEMRFVVSGLRREVAPEEVATLDAMLDRPNVISQLDTLDLSQLLRLIAHARAVITNDTSTAHLANGFGKAGAVLFGPASPSRFGANLNMRNFADHTCPLHPCVQWKCGNQENWCMRKISAREVGDHLANVLATSYAAAAKVA